jgi:hypothetical protein
MTFTISGSLIIMLLTLIMAIEGFIIFKLLLGGEDFRLKKGREQRLRDVVDCFRFFWPRFTIYIIGFGTVGLFIVSYVKKEELTLQIMNNWVGMVLGLVALIIGIISLYLSFYNLDQATDTQIKTHENLEEMKKDFKESLYELKVNIIDVTKDLATKDDLKGYYKVDTLAGGQINRDPEAVRYGWNYGKSKFVKNGDER